MSSATYRTAVSSFKQTSKSRFNALFWGSVAATGAIASYAYNQQNKQPKRSNPNVLNKALLGFGASKFEANVRDASVAKTPEYYQQVYNAIAQKLIDVDDYDYGSYGPLLVRLAWHNSGSYDQNDKTNTKGGSFAGTMRFKKEQADPENAGLEKGIEYLRSIHEKFPEISHGDLFTLGGVVAIQELGGPKVAWRPGRTDLGEDATPPYERLPAASHEEGDYIRTVFNKRMGFTDKEMVCLIGVGHSLGRCHVQNSGYDGPWTFSPTVVSNEFFKLLLSEDWREKKWSGKRQYEDEGTHSLMMLPADMALKKDSKFLKYVKEYAEDEEKCMKDFATAFSKLLERGIKFDVEPIYFKTLDEQS